MNTDSIPAMNVTPCRLNMDVAIFTLASGVNERRFGSTALQLKTMILELGKILQRTRKPFLLSVLKDYHSASAYGISE